MSERYARPPTLLAAVVAGTLMWGLPAVAQAGATAGAVEAERLTRLLGVADAEVLSDHTSPAVAHVVSFRQPGAFRPGTIWWGAPEVGSGTQLYAYPPPWALRVDPASGSAVMAAVGRVVGGLGLVQPAGSYLTLAAMPEFATGRVWLEVRGAQSVGNFVVLLPWSLRIGVTPDGTCMDTLVARSQPPWPGPPSEQALTAARDLGATALGLAPDAVDVALPVSFLVPNATARPPFEGPAWCLVVAPRLVADAATRVRLASVCLPPGQPPLCVPAEPLERDASWLATGLATVQARTHAPETCIDSALTGINPSADRLPTWLSDSCLASVSTRSRIGAPSWARRPGALRVDLTTSETAFVHPGWGRDIAWVTASDKLLVTSEEDLGKLRTTEAATGNWYEPTVEPAPRCYWPALSVDGKLLAYMRAGSGLDEDVFIDRLGYDEDADAIHGTGDHRRMRIDGFDFLPVFSPDGARVYFAHGVEREPAEQAQPPAEGEHEHVERVVDWSILSASTDAPHANREFGEVVDLPGQPGRLSVFPDGKRLLVWGEAGLWVVDLEAKSLAPLTLLELRDPDRPDAGPLKLREPAVSPDGTRIAFSGSVDPEADAEKGEWFVYVCKLDGSELRRVTPLADEPVGFYTFPESGDNAFDIEKAVWIERAEKAQQAELARIEAAREQLEKRQGKE